MNEAKRRARETFIRRMSKEAMAPYDSPHGVWEEDESEYLPFFLSLVKGDRRVLDLAGGYAKSTSALMEGGNSVILADLSLPSLMSSRKTLRSGDIQFLRLDMNRGLPFADQSFDGIWFAQAFEYIPPDMRKKFLEDLRRSMKRNGVLFLSAERVSGIKEWLSYLKWHLYWRIVRRAPIIWGETVYMLDLPDYKGWHYHSLILSRRFDGVLREAGFEVLRSKLVGDSDYCTYLLRAL